jgi:serine/threonine-protein kinase PRP4
VSLCVVKPDNIMVSETKKVKLCDFGSAINSQETQQMNSDCLVSRFYRSPEIIIGNRPLDGAIDVWSAAVTLFECFTGKFLFPGHSNNHMLQLIMQTRGKIKSKMLKRGIFAENHFNLVTGQFLQHTEDKVLTDMIN